MINLSFFKNKRIFITGHTGFKGMWLTKILLMAGADVTGFSLVSSTQEGAKLFHTLEFEQNMHSIIDDIRDYESLSAAFEKAKPEIVLHLAAQPLVLTSYEQPRYTYETNVMGTVNILECVRKCETVRSFLNITTDKVYLNTERDAGYVEDEPLDGFDPYSNSKSCSELVTHSYKNSFFSDGNVAISTARAGNVIGGGDFSENRIIPDCIRAAIKGEKIKVRNPYSTRPYQHVLEPLFAYLLIAEEQYKDIAKSGWYNVGPDDEDCVTTGELTDLFCKAWGQGISWQNVSVDNPHEANFLKLNSSKIKNTLGWRPRWHIQTAIEKTVEWAKVYQTGGNITECMEKQIREYMAEV